eukprot:TRINITY_DN2102_c0_g1_i1.p1 TRINITY_DN2102_c0_g1~~TRINITY_DN2102_c0_g1_i1.p1  ORF type:complete len:148 (-),score=24.84 TRINITY_DN2102_c0_g1_i1:120-563(-)
MSLLAASRRVAQRATSSPTLAARRHLGDGVRGPAINDVNGHLRQVGNFFSNGSVSYVEFKQQCMSLRIFVFAGVTGFCAFSLFWNPPKSSYWQRYSPSYWFYHIRCAFSKSSDPLFLKEKSSTAVDVPAVMGELVTTRRTKGQGESH